MYLTGINSDRCILDLIFFVFTKKSLFFGNTVLIPVVIEGDAIFRNLENVLFQFTKQSM